MVPADAVMIQFTFRHLVCFPQQKAWKEVCTSSAGAAEGCGVSGPAASSTSTGSETNLSLTRGPGAGCNNEQELQCTEVTATDNKCMQVTGVTTKLFTNTCPGAIVVLLAGKFLLPGRFLERVRWRGLRSGLRTRPVLALRASLKAVLMSFGGEPGAVGCVRCLESLPLACVDILTREVEVTERIVKDVHDVCLETIRLYMPAQA